MRQTMLKDRSLAENNTKLNNAKSIGSRNSKNNARGITLIALVITIIVLLILAGVSISAITGNDNAMKKAQQAKNDSEKGDELDFVKLAVVDAVAHSDDGWVTLANLQNAVADLDGVSATEGADAGEFTVIGKKANYTVYANGQVEEFKKFYLSKKTLRIEVGQTEDLTATLSPEIENQTITWTASGSVKIIENNTEKPSTTTEGTATLKILGKTEGNGTITVSAEGEDTIICNISVVNIPKVGDYIEYKVAYTDMYSGSYDSTTGWKILDSGTYNEGTKKYDNVKIISTGIPAKVYYNRGQPNGNTWWDKTKTGTGYQAAAGLANMTYFKNITFDGTGTNDATGWNKGQKGTIVNSDHTGVTDYSEDNCGIFLTTKASEVHNLTLAELNRARYGDTAHDDDTTAISSSNRLFNIGYAYFLASVVGEDGLRTVVNWR